MGFVVLHLKKAHGTDAATTAHIERTVMPSNADPERTHLNQRLVEYPEGVDNRTLAIQHRLDTAGLKRKIGNNQVRAICINLSGSPEDMKRIEAEGRLDDWCNDNVDWLRKTFGTANVVSADLHMDETTPHIHATLVPIVTGERRKAKSEQESGKKKYRKKSTDTARLCSDDVMTRDKLKAYQDTYAEAMSKYGLQRGIEGSEARHITTLEYYRNAVAQKQNLQENIEVLLQVEESKRTSLEDLNRNEQEARTRFEEADTLKQQKESELGETQAALKEVKGQLKTEKLKSTAAEVGSNILDGLGTMIGTSKVKRQQQEIDDLKFENQDLKEKISGLNQTINRERSDSEKVIGELKAEHTTVTDKLRQELTKIYDSFPHIQSLLNWESFLRKMKLTDNIIRQLFNRDEVRGSGELFSTEHSKTFRAENSTLKFDQDPQEHSKIRLTMNGVDIHDWFKQKNQEFIKSIGINIQPKQDREHKNGRGI